MASITLPYILYWTPIFQVVVLFLGTLLSSIIAINRGDANLYLPFISEMGALVPEIAIYSFTLIIGSFIGIIMILFRFLLVKFSLTSENTLELLNKISLYIGICSMIGLAGVAAFPMTTVFWAHLLFAGIYFFCMSIYMLLVTLFCYKKSGLLPIIKFRIVLCVCVILLLINLVICFPIALKNWHKANTTPPALKLPENEGFTLVVISSITEWSIAFVFILYTLTFLAEFKEYKTISLCISDQINENIVSGLSK